MKKIILLFIAFNIMPNLMAQKEINLDTLNIDQLNLYKGKAVKLRNTGMTLTLIGGTVLVVGGILFADDYDDSNLKDLGWRLELLVSSELVTVAGIPLWIIGGIRKSKVEIALKKFDIKPNNSMAVGLGITLRF
jgi:hypothetical protein